MKENDFFENKDIKNKVIEIENEIFEEIPLNNLSLTSTNEYIDNNILKEG